MAFLEEQFPSQIDYSSSGGPEFLTDIVELNSGHEQRNQVWEYVRHSYMINNLDIDTEIDAMVQFFMAARGRLHGFRLKDWQDYRTGSNFTAPTATDHILELVVGGAADEFQLNKRYVVDTEEYIRHITKPVAGTVLVSIDDVPSVAFSVDTTTGIVTMDVTPTTEVIKAGCEFDVPVRFDVDKLDGRHDFWNAETFSTPMVELKA